MAVPAMVWRLVRAATALIAIVAIVVQLKVAADANALNVVNFFSYFTIQSNIVGIVVLLILALRAPGPRPGWLESLRGAATVYLTITFIVVILLLSNIDVGLQLPWVDFVVHKLTPVVMVLDWLLDPPTVRLTRRDVLSWLVYPLIWLVYTMIRGPIADWYPYPFLNPANGGYGQVVITSAVILVAGTVLCLAFAWLGNRRAGGSPGRSLP